MQKKAYITLGLVGGSLVFALVCIWSIQPSAKQYSNQATSQTTTSDIAVTGNVCLDTLSEQLDSLKLQFTAEQTILREKLDVLQNALQLHIDQSETEQFNATRDFEVSHDEFVDIYQGMVVEEELIARIAQSDLMQQEEIASQLDVEEVDPEWSSWAEAEIRASLETNVDLNAKMINVVCHTTFCRVEGDFGGAASRGEVISQLMALVPWEAQAFFHEGLEESVSGALYIMKDGVTEYPNG